MKKSLFALLFAALPLLASATDLRIESPWIRAAPPGAPMLAGYVVLINDGEAVRRLVSARSERFGLVELHRTVQIDGIARMREVDGVDVPAGGRAALEPGGLHLMLMRPAAEISEGERIAFRLVFDDGLELAVEFVVQRTPSD